MIYILLSLWILSALFALFTQKISRIIIYMGVFSLTAAICFLLLGSPDVAMTEAAVSAFTTTFFVICFEKYFARSRFVTAANAVLKNQSSAKLTGLILPLVFVAFLFFLFVSFMPPADVVSTYLKYQYVEFFQRDVGGENAVTAIYLGYRVYDTLFEALMLVMSVVATMHMSHFTEEEVKDGKHSEIEKSGLAVYTIRVACPIMLMFGVYLIANGHLSPGGGFQGGLAIASFFVCRYMIYDIYDLPIHKVNKMEELVFATITLLAVLVVFQGAIDLIPGTYLPAFQISYLLVMNALIGLKVACSFIILFYRYIAIERR